MSNYEGHTYEAPNRQDPTSTSSQVPFLLALLLLLRRAIEDIADICIDVNTCRPEIAMRKLSSKRLHDRLHVLLEVVRGPWASLAGPRPIAD